MSVTLTEMPAPMVSVIAGSQAFVAGILIRTLSLPTLSCRAFAWATVASVSCASSGDTSIETRPSTPWVVS